jgi:DNA-binding XRE family transcriptional regulator
LRGVIYPAKFFFIVYSPLIALGVLKYYPEIDNVPPPFSPLDDLFRRSQIPKIIEFLGYDPFEKNAENMGDNIREYRRVHGLSQKKFAGMLGIDPATLAGWEKTKHHTTRRLLDKLAEVLI